MSAVSIFLEFSRPSRVLSLFDVFSSLRRGRLGSSSFGALKFSRMFLSFLVDFLKLSRVVSFYSQFPLFSRADRAAPKISTTRRKEQNLNIYLCIWPCAKTFLPNCLPFMAGSDGRVHSTSCCGHAQGQARSLHERPCTDLPQ